jgi:hypothetical protein
MHISCDKYRGKKLKNLMINISIFMACIIIVFVISGREKIRYGRYCAFNGYSWVLLEGYDKFEFNRYLTTSYRPKGTYEVKSNQLILTVNENEKYIFTIDENKNLVFKEGKYAEEIIPAGTIFELSEE